LRIQNKNLRIYFSLALVAALMGCATPQFQPFNVSEALLGAETESYETLKSLPRPKEKIAAAVYKFRDQTGQYKPSEFGQNFSTAVTQGATSILLRSLEESNWFMVIERENLNNLLNERKIIRSSRAQYTQDNNNDDPLLPPLLFAGVILEGGIISYDANVVTGGAGLRYFGAGASGQYREDNITVYLRAISTSNGRILKTVYTSKTILSQMIDIGFFRFVKFKRLLEIETGFTHNEPTQMAVTEAIEKAVQSMIIEGVIDGLWGLADTSDIHSAVIREYVQEKEDNEKTDFYGRYSLERRRKFGIGAAFGGQLYDGDYVDGIIKQVGEVSLDFNFNPNTTISFIGGYGSLATLDFFQESYMFADIIGTYRIFSQAVLSPNFIAGVGVLVNDDVEITNIEDRLFPKLIVGMGFEYLPKSRWALNVSFNYNYLLNDRLDAKEYGKYYDAYFKSTLGLKYYFGKKLM